MFDRRRAVRGWAAIVAVGLVLAGCSAAAGVPGRPPAAGTAPSATAPRRLVLGEGLPSALDRRTVRVVRRVPGLLGRDVLGVLALSAGGRLLVTAGRQSTVTGGEPRLAPERIGYLDPSSTSPRWIRPAQRPATEAWLGDLASGWAIWAQGSSTDLATLDMDLWSHEDGTGRNRRLGSSRRYRGKAMTIPGYNRPVIVGDRAYWSDIAPDFTPEHPRTAIYSRALDARGPVRLEVPGAFLSASDACGPPSLVYARSVLSGAVLPGGRAQVRRRTWTRNGVRDELLVTVPRAARTDLRDLAVCGDVVVYTTTRGADPGKPDDVGSGSLVVTRAGRVVATVTAPGDSVPAEPAVSGHWLVFDTYDGDLDGGQWLLDLADPTLYRLPAAPGLQEVRLRGDVLTWREPGRRPQDPGTTVLARLSRGD